MVGKKPKQIPGTKNCIRCRWHSIDLHFSRFIRKFEKCTDIPTVIDSIVI